MTEQLIQKKVIDKYTKDGWYVIKLIRTNKNGIPDLLCLKSNEIPLFIEVKTSKGIVSEIQKYRIKELNNFGFNAIIHKELHKKTLADEMREYISTKENEFDIF